MSKKKLGGIPQVAQQLIDHLPKNLNDDLKELIMRAEAGQSVTTEIVDLFSKHEITRLWLKEQLKIQSGEMGAPGYGPLAGNQGLVPPSQKWICPQKLSDEWLLVIQEGEDPPTCDRHHIEMVRENAGKG
jgi:hypothetical protein